MAVTISVSNAAETGDPAIFDHLVTMGTVNLTLVSQAALENGQTLPEGPSRTPTFPAEDLWMTTAKPPRVDD